MFEDALKYVRHHSQQPLAYQPYFAWTVDGEVHKSTCWYFEYIMLKRCKSLVKLAYKIDDIALEWQSRNQAKCASYLRGSVTVLQNSVSTTTAILVASGSFDETVKLWDVKSAECLQMSEGHSDYVMSVSFSPDGSKISSGSCDNTAKLWDVTGGKCLQTLEGHSDSVTTVSFSPDAAKVALGSRDYTVKLWEDPRVQER